MGNLFGRWRCKGVHPIHIEEGRGFLRSSKQSSSSSNGSSIMRVKVRMTKEQLKQLMSEVDLSKGSSELGQLIFNQCVKGRFDARVFSPTHQYQNRLFKDLANRTLSTIWEEERDGF